jgi:hypothetical protein
MEWSPDGNRILGRLGQGSFLAIDSDFSEK